MSAQRGQYSLGDIEYRPLGPDPIAAIENEAKRFGLRVSSGARSASRNRVAGGSPTSEHLVDNARDLAGDPQKMSEFYRHMRSTYGPNVKELYYDPEGGFKDGSDVGPIGKHGDHVHVSVGQRGQFKLADAEPATSPAPAPVRIAKPRVPMRQAQIENVTDQVAPVVQTRDTQTQPSTASLGVHTAFEDAKKQGDLSNARRYAGMLAKEGWEVGESEGWPYVKPPAGTRMPASQGTERFAEEQTRKPEPVKPSSWSRSRYMGITLPEPIAQAGVDVAAGAINPIVRAAQGVARLPGRIADEARRIPSIPGVYTARPQSTEPQIRASAESNPVEHWLGDASMTIEEFAQANGLPVGTVKELATAVGGLGPLLLLKRPLAIGGMTAAETYGRGEPLGESLKTGAEQAATMEGMGIGARGLDEVIVGKTLPRAATRLAGRTAVNVAAPNIIRAATGQEMHPVTPSEVVTGAGFALAHGVGQKPRPEASQRTPTGRPAATEPADVSTPQPSAERIPGAVLIPRGEPVVVPEGKTSTRVSGVGVFVHGPELTHADIRAAVRGHHETAATSSQQSQGRYRLEDARPVDTRSLPEAPSKETEAPSRLRIADRERGHQRRLARGNDVLEVLKEGDEFVTGGEEAGVRYRVEGNYLVGLKGGEGTALLVRIKQNGEITDKARWIAGAADRLEQKPAQAAPDETSHEFMSRRLHAAEVGAAKPIAEVPQPQLELARYDEQGTPKAEAAPQVAAKPSEPVAPPAASSLEARGASSRRQSAHDQLAALRRQSEDQLFQASNLSTEETDRVKAKLEALKKEVTPKRPLKTVVDEYLRQGGLFGQELNPDQQELLRSLASPTRRAKDTSEQGALFGDTSPTVESRREQSQLDKAGPTFGQGGLFQGTKEDWQMSRAEFEEKYGKPRRGATSRSENSQHKNAVAEAVYRGKPVPSEAVAEYPELAARAKKQSGLFQRASQMIGIFNAKGELKGTASLSQDTDPAKWVREQYGPGYTHGELTMDEAALRGEQKQIGSGKQTDTPEFRNWFGKSKVVDEKGEPLVVYHGTKADFDSFAKTGSRRDSNRELSKVGTFFTTDEHWANLYATDLASQGAAENQYDKAIIYPVHLSLQNPARMGQGEFFAAAHSEGGNALRERLQAQGYDGIIATGDQYAPDEYVAFEPTQIKSAIGNRGTFDPKNPNILFQADQSPEHKLLSNVIDTYAEEGVTDFKTAVKRWTDDFGPAEEYADIFQEAWDANKNVKKRGKATFESALERAEPKRKGGTDAEELDLVQYIRNNGGINMGSALQGEQRNMRESRLKQPGVFTKDGLPWDDMETRMRSDGYLQEGESLLDALDAAARGEKRFANSSAYDEQIEREWKEAGRKEFAENSDHSIMARAFDNQADPAYSDWVKAFNEIKQSDNPDSIEAFKHYSSEIRLSPEAINRLIESAGEYRATESDRTQRTAELASRGATVPTDATSFKAAILKHFRVRDSVAEAATVVHDAFLTTLEKFGGPKKADMWSKLWVASGGKGEGLEQSDASPFYSQLQRTLESQTQGRFTPEQLEAVLRKTVKPDEMKWTGFDDFLAEKKAKGERVTKEEALEFARQNAVEVREVTKGARGGKPKVDETRIAELESKLTGLRERVEKSPVKAGDKVATVGAAPSRAGYSYSTGKIYEAYINADGALAWKKAGEFGGTRSGRSDKFIRELKAEAEYPWSHDAGHGALVKGADQEAFHELSQTEKEIKRAQSSRNAPTKFKDYQIPGGKNYRELLLTLPRRDPVQADRAFTAYQKELRAKYGDDAVIMRDATPQEIKKLNDLGAPIRESRADTPEFKGGHFDEPNVLAHIRFNERTDSDGKRVLFIEEVQSDWHQAGRRHGYKGQEPMQTEPPPNTRVIENKPGFWAIYKPNGELTTGFTDRQAALNWAWSSYEGQRIPDAPFKTTWPDLAMKRAIRWAAENGFDKVAWTTGEQQAERYDLSKHLESISATKTMQGDYAVQARDKSGRVVLDDVYKPDKLPDVVGKDLADKIVAEATTTPREGHAHSKTYSGLDLKVGGEGMKGFYDKILPSVASKLGKKFGAKAGETSISTSEQLSEAKRKAMVTPEVLRKAAQLADSENQKDIAAALREQADKSDAGRPLFFSFAHPVAAVGAYVGRVVDFDARVAKPVHSLAITPEMRASAMQGQPLFQGPRGMTQFLKSGQAVIRALQNPNESTALHEIHHALLPQFMRLTGQEGISEQFGRDMGHMARWMNLRDAAHFNELHEQYQNGTLKGRELKRYIDAQEKGARGFEKYLRTGKAPTPALEAAFARFKEWLTNIYQNLKGSEIDIDIGPRQTAVWDRMLGGKGESGPKVTGIKNATVAEEREARGLDPVEQSLRRGFGQVLDEGKRIVDENPYFRESVVNELIQNPRAPSDAEDAALAYDRMKLHNEHRAALKEMGDAIERDDASGAIQADFKMRAIEKAIDLNDQAAKKAGTESGRSLNARKMMIREDYSMATMIQKAKAAAREAGKTLSPETEKLIRDMADTIAEKDSLLDAREKIINEQQAQLARQEKVENWSKAAKRKGVRAPAVLDAELGSLETAFAKLTGHEGLLQADKYEGPFNDEMRKLIKAIARNRVEAGARTAEAVNADVHRIVSKYLPDVEARDVGDVWSEYGKVAKLSMEEIDVAMREAKRQERLLIALEDAQAGVSPARSGLQRGKMTARVKELTKQIKEAMRETGLIMEKAGPDPEKQWLSALKTFKTRTANSTKEYQRRLDEGDYVTTKRKPLVLDETARDLMIERDRVKRQYQVQLAKLRPGRWKREILSGANLPRAILASFDLSAPLRQGAILTLPPTQWKIAAKAGVDMFRSLSKKQHDQFRLQLEHDPVTSKAKAAKLHLSTLVDGEFASLVQREEAFMSRFADKIPGVSHSQNAYVAYLDSLRMQTFKKFVEAMPNASTEDLADVAKFINYATGRGDLGKLGNAVAPALNAVFFAPRYLASRVQIMNPATYIKMTPMARKMAAKNLVQFTGVLGTALGLAAAAGLQVGVDPDDADFLKIKVGNTRYDALAGFQQLARFGWGMLKGFYNNVRGVKNPWGRGPAEIAGRFLRTKLSPPAGFAVDLAVGKNFKGESMSDEITAPGKMAFERLSPILVRDIYDAWKDAEQQGQTGARGAAKAAPSFFGIGVQTYGARAKSSRSANPLEDFKRQLRNDPVKEFKKSMGVRP